MGRGEKEDRNKTNSKSSVVTRSSGGGGGAGGAQGRTGAVGGGGAPASPPPNGTTSQYAATLLEDHSTAGVQNNYAGAAASSSTRPAATLNTHTAAARAAGAPTRGLGGKTVSSFFSAPLMKSPEYKHRTAQTPGMNLINGVLTRSTSTLPARSTRVVNTRQVSLTALKLQESIERGEESPTEAVERLSPKAAANARVKKKSLKSGSGAQQAARPSCSQKPNKKVSKESLHHLQLLSSRLSPSPRPETVEEAEAAVLLAQEVAKKTVSATTANLIKALQATTTGAARPHDDAEDVHVDEMDKDNSVQLSEGGGFSDVSSLSPEEKQKNRLQEAAELPDADFARRPSLICASLENLANMIRAGERPVVAGETDGGAASEGAADEDEVGEQSGLDGTANKAGGAVASPNPSASVLRVQDADADALVASAARRPSVICASLEEIANRIRNGEQMLAKGGGAQEDQDVDQDDEDGDHEIAQQPEDRRSGSKSMQSVSASLEALASRIRESSDSRANIADALDSMTSFRRPTNSDEQLDVVDKEDEVDEAPPSTSSEGPATLATASSGGVAAAHLPLTKQQHALYAHAAGEIVACICDVALRNMFKKLSATSLLEQGGSSSSSTSAAGRAGPIVLKPNPSAPAPGEREALDGGLLAAQEDLDSHSMSCFWDQSVAQEETTDEKEMDMEMVEKAQPEQEEELHPPQLQDPAEHEGQHQREAENSSKEESAVAPLLDLAPVEVEEHQEDEEGISKEKLSPEDLETLAELERIHSQEVRERKNSGEQFVSGFVGGTPLRQRSKAKDRSALNSRAASKESLVTRGKPVAEVQQQKHVVEVEADDSAPGALGRQMSIGSRTARLREGHLQEEDQDDPLGQTRCDGFDDDTPADEDVEIEENTGDVDLQERSNEEPAAHRNDHDDDDDLVAMMMGGPSNNGSKTREQRRSKGKEHCRDAERLSKEVSSEAENELQLQRQLSQSIAAHQREQEDQDQEELELDPLTAFAHGGRDHCNEMMEARQERRSKSKEHCTNARRLSISRCESPDISRELEDLRREVNSSREASRSVPPLKEHEEKMTRKNPVISQQQKQNKHKQNKMLHPKLPNSNVPLSNPKVHPRTVSSFIAEHNKTDDDRWCDRVISPERFDNEEEEDAAMMDRYCMSMSLDADGWRDIDDSMRTSSRNPLDAHKLKLEKLEQEHQGRLSNNKRSNGKSLDLKQIGKNVEDTVLGKTSRSGSKKAKKEEAERRQMNHVMSMSKNQACKRTQQNLAQLNPPLKDVEPTTMLLRHELTDGSSGDERSPFPTRDVAKSWKKKSGRVSSLSPYKRNAAGNIKNMKGSNKNVKKKSGHDCINTSRNTNTSLFSASSTANASFQFSDVNERSTELEEKKQIGDAVVYSYQLAAQMFYLLAQVDSSVDDLTRKRYWRQAIYWANRSNDDELLVQIREHEIEDSLYLYDTSLELHSPRSRTINSPAERRKKMDASLLRGKNFKPVEVPSMRPLAEHETVHKKPQGSGKIRKSRHHQHQHAGAWRSPAGAAGDLVDGSLSPSKSGGHQSSQQAAANRDRYKRSFERRKKLMRLEEDETHLRECFQKIRSEKTELKWFLTTY
eukprot:g13803.t1